ncbi:MAG: ABC transporter ATP-binding protein [Leptothrix sp. (in: b-proteobacteria)]
MFAAFERLIDPYPQTRPVIPPTGFFAFIWASCEGTRRYIAAMTFFTALTGAFEALLFGMLGQIVDWLGKVAPGQLWVDARGQLLLLAGIIVLSPLMVLMQTLFKHQTLAGNFPMRLRWNFHRLMLGQSMAFYQDEFAGRVAAKVMQSALAVRDTVMIVCDILVFVVIYFVTMGFLVGGFNGWMLLPFAAWLVLYVGVIAHFVPRLARVSKAQADARSMMTGRITDAYTNISTVKLFSHAQREAGFARSAMQEFMHTVHGQMRLVSAFEVVIHCLSMLFILGTASAALYLWTRGEVGIGAVAAATAMALRLNGISHWVMWEVSNLFEQIGTVQDGLGMLSRPHAVVDAPGALPLVVSRGEVRFEAVDFAYGAAVTAAAPGLFSGFNLHIRPGEKIGVVGRSGAGKSTIVNLLLRFYDLGGGRVTIDGQDIAHVTQDSLRAQVGMVTQDTSLLHRSVRDNILYGRPDAGDAQMVSAARRAQAHDFIQELADAKGRTGYDAHVGERGVKLSGGQRQRIAIARVMLKDAPILLLDEATSALDSEVEAAIQATLVELMQGKTVVAIAHRLSTIAAMDRLIVLDRGRIVEQGSHAELLAHGGLYARLWAHQSGGFLGEDAGEEAVEAAAEAAADVDDAADDTADAAPVAPAVHVNGVLAPAGLSAVK